MLNNRLPDDWRVCQYAYCKQDHQTGGPRRYNFRYVGTPLYCSVYCGTAVLLRKPAEVLHISDYRKVEASIPAAKTAA